MTEDKAKAIVAELAAVCRKHNVVIAGTCEHEGIYGEITIHDRDDKETWRELDRRTEHVHASHDGDWYVDAIGNEPLQG